MIVCLDVDYRDPVAVAAAVGFTNWEDASPALERTLTLGETQPYESGRFYLRELPCLLSILRCLDDKPATILIDGYVWLKDDSHPGLGGHLFQALDARIPIIGIAKTRYLSASCFRPIERGASKQPLYITAAGLSLEEAAAAISRMHGPYRVPTLIRRADQLCRNTPSQHVESDHES